MPKSNYPNKLDTSIEIPVVRDNITEIGSDVLNSLRSAIFNIEKTLGINPQGAIGSTVAERVSGVIDSSGNLKKDALDRANILSGPISDPDVSATAAIRESKLSLDFPTQLLQDEISYVNNQIEDIIQKITELNAIISTHVHPDSTNRHKAGAISVDASVGNPGDVASLSLETGDLQDTIETIYDDHINYTGLNISSTNNSHLASQIYYNNEETEDIIKDEDVQSAITTLAGLGSSGLRNFILNLSSNGIVRSGSIFDNHVDDDSGEILIDETSITYTHGYESVTNITFPEHPVIDKDIFEFDILKISNAASDEDDGFYKIKSITTNSSMELLYIDIYGTLREDSEAGTIGRITKGIYVPYNENGLNCAIRQRILKTNTPEVQVANPNSATVISKGISPEELTPDSHIFSISVDDGDYIDIETYDDSVDQQSIDSILHIVNKQLIEGHLNCLAYKLRVNNCYEVAIAHNLPNISGDILNRTIKVTSGTSDDGLSRLGLSHVDGVEHQGHGGNSYHINGYLHDTFGRIQSLTSNDLRLTIGTPRVGFVDSEASEYDIRIGDLMVISGSSEPSDDGTYRITDITDSSIYIDDGSITFNGELEDDVSIVHIIRCTAPVGELTFTEAVLPEGHIIFDVFLDENKNPFYRKRLEVDGDLVQVGFYAGVVDVSRNFIVENQDAIVYVDDSDSTLRLEDPSGQTGERVYVNTSGNYKVYSADGLSYVTVQVHMSSPPPVSMQITLNGFKDIATDNLHLCRGIFATSLGYVFGHSDGDQWVPVVTDKRNTGTVDKTIISENILEKYIQGPRNELRGSGVVSGCEILNHQESSEVLADGTTLNFQTVDISAGVLVVNGIRIEFAGLEEYRVNSSSDFYIGIDAFGCIVSADGTAGAEFPFKDVVIALLAHIQFVGGGSSIVTDLRLFVDHIDYKYLGDITVSNDQRFGHFTSIHKAVDYARMFVRIFEDTGTPSILIKEGTYEVDETIYIDFDLAIRGVGPGTIITRSNSFAAHSSLNDWGTFNSVFFIGCIPSDPLDSTTWDSSSCTSYIEYGVTVENFTYKLNPNTNGQSSVINLQKEIDESSTCCFRFSNINFQGDEIAAGAHMLEDAEESWEFALRVGSTNSNTYGNIIFKDNFLNWMGYGDGGVYFDAGNTYMNVVISNNISTNVYGAIGVQSGSGYGIMSDYSWGVSTFTRVLETDNISDDQ